MGKRVVTAIIDNATGKITVLVDGFPHDECVKQAKKIGGRNATLRTKKDIKTTTGKHPKNISESQSEEKITEDEKHEQRL